MRQDESDNTSEISEPSTLADRVQKINFQPVRDCRGRDNRFILQFHMETPKEVKNAREQARAEIIYSTDEELEVEDDFFDGYDFPVRPEWNFQMKKETLLANEERYFFKYITAMEKSHFDDMKSLSYCELNIETWRQLWRVFELSDIILVIVDARFPNLMFPPSIYNYVNTILKKNVVILLNKIDLVESEIVLAWKKYIEGKYKEIKVVLFTSYPSYNLRGSNENKHGLKIRRRRGKQRMASEGAMEVYQACSSIVKDQVDLSSWLNKIKNEMSAPVAEGDDEEEVEIGKIEEEVKDFDFEEHELYQNGVLTVGTIGFPNVGKSSVLNALMGRKVVSVSRTPGHTKHFQTIFLTEKVRLVDCPGLVFPSKTPKPLQILLGSFPIAQLREPYATVKFLAERVNLQKLLAIQHPEGSEKWSAMDICEAFAIKRGFLTAKAARPDTYRAANSILRMALDGKITMSLKPKGFHRRNWSNHEELAKVKEVQAQGRIGDKADEDGAYSDSDNECMRPSDYQMKIKSKTESNEDVDGDDEDTDYESDEQTGVSNPFDALADED